MTCPICQKPTEKPFSPFCSRRCADIDLSRWLKGTYAIPGGPGDEDGDDPVNGASERPNSRENNGFSGPDKGMDRE